MLTPNAKLMEQAHIVTGLAPITPSSSTPDYVSLKGYERCTVVIVCDNATTVTGSAITLKQDVSVAGSTEKALAFSTYYANTDSATASALTETTATNNTFTTNATNNNNSLYVIEVKAEDLDVANGFDCLRAGTGDATAQVLAVLYILWPARYGDTAINATAD